jgi:hypothetical protein
VSTAALDDTLELILLGLQDVTEMLDAWDELSDDFLLHTNGRGGLG